MGERNSAFRKKMSVLPEDGWWDIGEDIQRTVYISGWKETV